MGLAGFCIREIVTKITLLLIHKILQAYYGFRCHGDLLYNYTTRLDQTRFYLIAVDI